MSIGREIQALIAAGQTIIIFEKDVLRVNNGWKDRHPGGKLVFDHMIGRDATDEISAMHTQATLKTMSRYRIGRVAGPWINMVPPIQGGQYRALEQDGFDTDSSLDDDASVVTDSGIDCGSVSDASSSDSSVKEGLHRRAAHRKEEKPLMHSKLQGGSAREGTATFIAETIQREIDIDLAKYPSLDSVTQRDIALKFQELHQRVKTEGYYECRYIEYAKEMIRYSALFAMFVFTLKQQYFSVSACFLGLFWHQIMFTAHDAGHRGITKNITKDTLIGIFIADFCCGLSIGWWKSSHNVHHLVTNAPEHDPDIQNTPLFATAPAFLKTVKSTYYGGFEFVWDAAAAVLVRIQPYTYYPVMGIARFNLYILSWGYLISGRSRNKGTMWWTRPTEIAAMTCYWFLFFYVLLWCSIPTWTSRVIFVLTSHLITMPLHVQITLSHWGTSTADLGPGESFAQRQLRTTMDVACPQWLDFVHGGLQFQAVHHLFPRVPRHNLRKLQRLVREFCKETEIEYMIHGFVAGNGVVLGRLQQVADQARMMAQCQRHMAATGESGLH